MSHDLSGLCIKPTKKLNCWHLSLRCKLYFNPRSHTGFGICVVNMVFVETCSVLNPSHKSMHGIDMCLPTRICYLQPSKLRPMLSRIAFYMYSSKCSRYCWFLFNVPLSTLQNFTLGPGNDFHVSFLLQNSCAICL